MISHHTQPRLFENYVLSCFECSWITPAICDCVTSVSKKLFRRFKMEIRSKRPLIYRRAHGDYNISYLYVCVTISLITWVVVRKGKHFCWFNGHILTNNFIKCTYLNFTASRFELKWFSECVACAIFVRIFRWTY